jgi:hypothetical protein
MSRANLKYFLALTFLAPTTANAGTITYECVYTESVSPEGRRNEKDFHLKFIHDTISRETIMVGNMGMTPIEVVSGIYGVTFIEKLGTGAVQTTTVDKAGNTVHSRHTMMSDGLDTSRLKEPGVFPSQYYGKCSVQVTDSLGTQQ